MRAIVLKIVLIMIHMIMTITTSEHIHRVPTGDTRALYIVNSLLHLWIFEYKIAVISLINSVIVVTRPCDSVSRLRLRGRTLPIALVLYHRYTWHTEITYWFILQKQTSPCLIISAGPCRRLVMWYLLCHGLANSKHFSSLSLADVDLTLED